MLRSLFLSFGSYTCITDLILVLRSLFLSFGSYTCIMKLILVLKILFVCEGTRKYCSDPQAQSDPNGESEPKPGDAQFISFIFRVIKISFSKMSRPESPARPEWQIRTGARFTPAFSFILSKHFINSFSCGSGFSFGQAHNHL